MLLDRIKNIMKSLGDYDKAGFDRIEPAQPKDNPEDIFGIMPVSRAEQYDTYDIIKRLVDNSEYEEYKPDYGKTIVCATARIDGWSVGIVANQRKLVKVEKAKCSLVELFIPTVRIKPPVLLQTVTKEKFRWYFYRMLQVLW